MKTSHYVTRNMYLYHSWLADLAGTVIETHLQQRRPHAEPPHDDDDNAIVTRTATTDETDEKQVGAMSAETVYP